MSYVDITGLDIVEAFRRLYNGAKPLGYGIKIATPGDMPYEQAQREFSNDVDYHRGRVMKVRFQTRAHFIASINGMPGRTPEVPPFDMFFRSDLYNRDNGDGAAELIIAQLRRES